MIIICHVFFLPSDCTSSCLKSLSHVCTATLQLAALPRMRLPRTPNKIFFWVVVNSNHEQLGNHWTTMLLLDANSQGQSFAPSHLSCLSKQNWIEYAIVILRQNDKPTWPSTQPQHLPLAFQQWLWNTFGSALTHFHFVPYRFDGLWQSSCVLTNRSS